MVNYLYGKAEISAVIVILGAACLGALTIFLLGIYRQIKTGFRVRGLQGELGELRSRLQELEMERDYLLVQVGQLQEAVPDCCRVEAETGDPLPADDVLAGAGEVTMEKDKEMEASAPAGANVSTGPRVEDNQAKQEVEKTQKKEEKEL